MESTIFLPSTRFFAVFRDKRREEKGAWLLSCFSYNCQRRHLASRITLFQLKNNVKFNFITHDMTDTKKLVSNLRCDDNFVNALRLLRIWRPSVNNQEPLYTFIWIENNRRSYRKGKNRVEHRAGQDRGVGFYQNLFSYKQNFYNGYSTTCVLIMFRAYIVSVVCRSCRVFFMNIKQRRIPFKEKISTRCPKLRRIPDFLFFISWDILWRDESPWCILTKRDRLKF